MPGTLPSPRRPRVPTRNRPWREVNPAWRSRCFPGYTTPFDGPAVVSATPLYQGTVLFVHFWFLSLFSLRPTGKEVNTSPLSDPAVDPPHSSPAPSPDSNPYPNLPATMAPLITHIYTADPSAHVFEGRVYIYPSHDRETDIQFNDNGDQYDMADYHVFSTDSLDPAAPVVDHGVVLRTEDIPWVSKQLWAPDAAQGRDGKCTTSTLRPATRPASSASVSPSATAPRAPSLLDLSPSRAATAHRPGLVRRHRRRRPTSTLAVFRGWPAPVLPSRQHGRCL